ncbi:MAG TPA: Ig-like domain-containing protein [Kofleriaceae bacterium]|nr:Ig-like domain-containing protein [Kofleriaceae bacterium]
MLLVVGLGACGDNTGGGPPAVVVQSVAITPPTPTLAAGTSTHLSATARLSDATTKDVSGTATWSSSDKAVATVSATGVVTGVAAGSATITATLDGITGTANVAVTAATLDEIQVTPTDPAVPAGIAKQLTAMGLFSDGSKQDLTAQVTWASSDTDHVTVSATGLARAIAKGSATITASMGAVSGATTINATDAVLTSIEIDPNPASVALGRQLKLTATGMFSDASHQDLTTQVHWLSGTTDHATIDGAGVVTTVAVGGSTVTATFGTGAEAVTGTIEVAVTAAELVSIAVTPTDASVAAGRTEQFKATGTFTDHTQDITDQVAWSSSDDAVAQVSSADGSRGLATTSKPGTITVTATATTPGSPVSGSTSFKVTDAVLVSIQVTPINPSVAKGHTQRFKATGTFSDHNTKDLTAEPDLAWKSSDENIAKISNADPDQGLATAISEGEVTVTATVGNGGNPISDSTNLTVTAAVLDSIAVTPTDSSVAVGLAQPFVAMGTFSDATVKEVTTEVTWTSSDDAIASISNVPGEQGHASTHKTGEVTITAAQGTISGHTKLTVTDALLVSIQVDPPVKSIAAGTTQAFTARGTFTDQSTKDLTDQVTWGATPSGVATISNDPATIGVATAVAQGEATITATRGSVSGQAKLTVTDAVVVSIQLEPIAPSLPAGLTLQFKAVGTFSDQSTQDLTSLAAWSSADDTVARVSNVAGERGLATAIKVGPADISAVFGGVTGTTTLTVTPAVVVAIKVDPALPSLALGRTLPFTATALLSDTTSHDVTDQVAWASADEAIATISNAPGEQGLTTARGVGPTVITASLNGVTGSTTLTVTSAELDSIEVTPADSTLPKGRTQQLKAIGTFSDLKQQDLTAQVTWSSTDPAVAQVTSGPTGGLVTALGVGPTTISATLSGKTGSTTLTVTAAVIDSIAVTPLTVSLAKGRTQQFTALGTLSDTTTQDLTGQVTWSSDDTTIAQISSAGLATTLKVGATTIRATLDGVVGTASLAVTNAVLDSIAITPLSPTTVPNGTVQLTATGTFSDSTTQNLTTTATWSSLDTAIANVSDASGSKGRVTGVAVGSVAITATSGTIVGSTTVTVLPPDVSVALPRDGTSGNRLSTTIVAVFNQAVLPATVTAQTATGACSGSLQVSADGFTTCLGFTNAAPTITAGNTVATGTLAEALQPQTTYKIRVLATVTNPAGVPLAAQFDQTTGFATGTGATCASGLVISQVYGGGGNSGAPLKNDFIELHNGGSTPFDLTGTAVQYAAAGQGTWQVTVLPSVTIPPGGYFLIQENSNNATGAPLPTPDVIAPNGGIAMGSQSGKVALTSSTTLLTGNCPVTGSVIDFVGYGIAPTLAGGCFEGVAGTAPTANDKSAQRAGAGCTDTNSNSLDFTIAAPVPRNSSTAVNVCSCP